MRAVGHKDTVDSLKTLIKTLKMNDPSGRVRGYRTLTFVDNSQRNLLLINEAFQLQHIGHLCKI